MADLSAVFENFVSALTAALGSIVDRLPNLLAALILLLLGWLAARLLRRLARRLGAALNRMLERYSRRGGVSRELRLTPAVLSLLGNVVFWLTVLVFIALSARVAELQLFTAWLDRVSAYVPTLLVGGLILLAGFLASILARDTVTAAMESAGSRQGDRFGLLAQSSVFLVALVIGLDQIGIDVLFLTILFALAVGGVVLSLALAFGLGAGCFVSNLIGASQAQRTFSPGETVRVAGLEGQVVEFTPTAVVLAGEQGRLVIPGKTFQDEAVLVVAEDLDE